MKQFYKNHIKVFVSILVFCIFAVSGAVLGYFSTLVPKTSSITTTDTTSYVKIGEIFNSTDKVFYETTLSQFYHCITGITGANADTVKSKILASSTNSIPASTIRGYTASGSGYSKSNTQSVVVRLGGLDWIVTYLSLNTDGDVIATLWLDDNVQDAWADTTTYSNTFGEYYGFVDGGLYGTFSYGWMSDWDNWGDILYPSNLYSTSYIRGSTLNNGSGYATENANATLTTATQNTNNPFAMHTMEQFGLTQFLEKPKNISWQVNAQTPGLGFSNTSSAGSQLNNDSLSVGANCSTVEHDFCNDIITVEKYAEWGNDYVWLPSISETGYSSTYSGIWGLNDSERASNTGVNSSKSGVTIGSINSATYYYTCTMTRSASFYYTTASKASYYLYQIYAPGNSYYSTSYYVTYATAIRPALHLNLSDVYTGFKVSGEANISGAGTITGGGVYKLNDSVTLTATPNEAYYFSHWQDASGNTVTTNTSFTITVTNHATYTAVFKPKSYITTQSGDIAMGTATGGGYFLPTATATIQAKPNTGYVFLYWQNSAGTIVSYSGTYTFTASATDTYTAIFKAISVSFVTPNSGAEISKQTTDSDSTIISNLLLFTSGNYIASIQLGTGEVVEIKSQMGTVSGGSYCTSVRYTVDITGCELLIEVINLKADLTITLGFTNTPQNLKESGTSVEGIFVIATKGGIAYAVGDDFESLADTDTIIFTTKQVLQGYTFSHWQDLDGNNLGEEMSIRLQKSLVIDKLITAVYVQNTNNNVNDEISN